VNFSKLTTQYLYSTERNRQSASPYKSQAKTMKSIKIWDLGLSRLLFKTLNKSSFPNQWTLKILGS